MATRSGRPRDNRPAGYATQAPTLDRRIEDMERRLALERAQAVAHAREFGGDLRRRMTSPTSLVFSASMGFLVAEFIGARSRVVKEAQRRGESRRQQKAAGKSVFASIVTPLLPLLRVGALGFFAKKNQDIAQHVSEATGVDSAPPTVH